MIRRATVDDALAIAGVQVRGHQWAYRGLLPDAALDAQTAEARLPSWQQQLAEGSDRHAFVAERDGRVVGFAIGGPAEDATRAGECADGRERGDGGACGELYAIYIEREVVGSGVGRALLAAVIDDLRARGFVRAVLWILDGNERGRRFYERAGWCADGGVKSETRAGHERRELRYTIALR